MKKTFQKIIDICEQNQDSEGTLRDIRIKAKNRVIRYEWEEKYGIVTSSDWALVERDWVSVGEYQRISYFKDGYANNGSRSISWSEGGKQPVDEWLYEISFSTGAFIFGEDYEGQKQLFRDFFEELRTYKPDYEDLTNHYLYWKLKNAKEIMFQFNIILQKYHDKNRDELHNRKIEKLKLELADLEKNK